ncbi:MAG: hypothetical protein WCX71_03875 [Candidatus Buchananbacteria bacterium]
MARIIRHQPEKIISEDESDKEFDSLPAPKKKSKKISFKNQLRLALGLVVVFGLLTSVAAVAATGIFNIPVFSRIFYHLPQPARLVDIPLGDFKPSAEGFSVKSSSEEGLIVFDLGEREFTYILRQALTSKADSRFAPNLQVVITPDWLEFYGLQLKPFKANLTLRIKPQVVNKMLTYQILECKIGSLHVPAWLAQYYLNRGMGQSQDISQKIMQMTRLEKLDLMDGKFSLVAWVDTKALMSSVITNLSQSKK